MLTIDQMIDEAKFFRTPSQQIALLESQLNELTQMHLLNCKPYSNIVNAFFGDYKSKGSLEEIPFIPIGLFKQLDLISVPVSSVVRTLNSSGTSGNTSRVYLDKTTAINQIKVLTEIFRQSVSAEKMPMVVVEAQRSLRPEDPLNARLAAVKGFSIFASETHYIVDEHSKIHIQSLKELEAKYRNTPVLFFGFTFVIWRDLLDELERNRVKLNFPEGVMIHGGGWKNLTDRAVSNEDFKNRAKKTLGVKSVINYYGMAEQTGSLYFECSESYLHTTPFGHVITRNKKDFTVTKLGEEGIIQLLSVIPRSYPGHSILTEDLGIVFGESGCKCGKPGRFFKILGRLPEAEIRGCSDVYGGL